jgi:flagellar hook-associated protein 1
MSLFEALSVANRGLAASQLAINVTGQNISNAKTEGYSRKRIDQAADWRRDGTYGQFGFGVEVYSVARVRDQFIDRQLNEESTRYGYYEQMDVSYERVENMFTEPSDTGLNTLLDNFWNAWSDVANNPSDSSARETLCSTSATLTEQFHFLTNELRSYKNTINDEIESQVVRINEITAGIAKCNVVIANAESDSGDIANDSRDQRDTLLNELASIVDVEYFEDERGVLTVTTNGQMLVSTSSSHDLEMVRTEVSDEDGYQYSEVGIRYSLSKTDFEPKDGKIKAMLDTRDDVIPEYEASLNAMAKGLVTTVNKVHQNGYNLAGLTGISFFDPTKLNAANIDLSVAIKDDVNNVAAGVGGKVTGVTIGSESSPYVVTAPNDQNLVISDPAISAQFSAQYRNILKESLTISVVNNTTTPATVTKLEEGASGDYVVDYEKGVIRFTTPMTGANLIIDFDYNDTGFAGVGDGENAIAIGALREKAVMQPDVFGKETQSINEYYSGMLGRLGTERDEAISSLETRTVAVQNLEARQQEVCGVNLNEEMASLIQYEHTYQAAARYLSTVSDMLDILLNI